MMTTKQLFISLMIIKLKLYQKLKDVLLGRQSASFLMINTESSEVSQKLIMTLLILKTSINIEI